MKKIEFTGYWVQSFGWEDTVFLQSDFTHIEELGRNEQDGIIFLCMFENCKHILKGVYIN